jgi:hypothetical protein
MGNAVKSERRNGAMPDRENPSGPAITWDFLDVRFLTPEFDTLDIRFPVNGSVPVPARDELVLLRCDARVSGGNLRLDAVAVLDPDALSVAAV